MNAKEKQEILRDLAAIRGLAGRLQSAGIPLVESCARWCETYSRMAQWSLGDVDRFAFMEAVGTEDGEKAEQRKQPAETIRTTEPRRPIEPIKPKEEPRFAMTAKPVASGNGKVSRWGFAVDLKRCVGCQSCTLACKVENGTPHGIFWMRVLEKEEGTYPSARKVFMPLRCNHCSEPPCVPVCPTGASYKREKDNIVLIDQDKCIGCRACIVACPYQVRFFSEDAKGYYGDQKTPSEVVSHQKWQPRTVQKCTFCVHRIDQGLEPACVQTCPTESLIFGDLDDPQSEISMLVRGRSHFKPRAELGTDPNLYYLT